MCSLSIQHPEIAAEFEEGAFVAHKIDATFSAIALDHAHEQCNAVMKGDGGTTGLMEKPESLKRWMLAGPEIARLIKEFEQEVDVHRDTSKSYHHEQTPSKQMKFGQEVISLKNTIDDLGNPFTESSQDLYNLCSKDVASDEVVKTVKSIESTGVTQFNDFVQEHIILKNKLLSFVIKKNKIPIFSNASDNEPSRTSNQLSGLKMYCSLF